MYLKFVIRFRHTLLSFVGTSWLSFSGLLTMLMTFTHLVGWVFICFGVLGLYLVWQANSGLRPFVNGPIPKIFMISQNPASVSCFLLCIGLLFASWYTTGLICMIFWPVYIFCFKKNEHVNHVDDGSDNNHNSSKFFSSAKEAFQHHKHYQFYIGRTPVFMSLGHLLKILQAVVKWLRCVVILSLLALRWYIPAFGKLLNDENTIFETPDIDVRRSKARPQELDIYKLMEGVTERFLFMFKLCVQFKPRFLIPKQNAFFY